MKYKKIYLIIVCLTIITTLFMGCRKNSAEISLKLKKGDSFKIEVSNDEKIKLKECEIKSKCKSSYLCEVTNVDESKNADIKVTLDNINLKIDNPTCEKFMTNIFPINKELNKIYSIIIGESFKVKIGEYGNVKSIIGIDKLVKNVLKTMNVKDKKLEKQLKDCMKKEFGEDILTKKIETFTSVYPKERVNVNKPWDNKMDVDIVFDMGVNNKYVLKESRDNVDKISIKGKIISKENCEPIIIDKMKVYYDDITGTQDGSVSVNEDTGLIRKGEFKKVFNGDLKILEDDPNIGIKKIPINIKNNITVNVLMQ